MPDESTKDEDEQKSEYEWYLVQMTIPWTVNGVDGVQDAINIAISEVGKKTEEARTRQNDINVHAISCPNDSCDTKQEAVLLVGEMAMVGLALDTEVQATDVDHSRKVAITELGQYLEDVPIEVYNVIPPVQHN